MINEFLECLDGAVGREGVVLIGACMGRHSASWGRVGDKPAEMANFNPSMMARVDRILRQEIARAKAILETHREAVVFLWNELRMHGDLSGEEVRNAMPGSDKRTSNTPQTVESR